MADRDFSSSLKASNAMLDRLALSDAQLTVMRTMNLQVAIGGKMASKQAESLGLSSQEAIHAIKASLAAFLAGLEASPDLDEMDRRGR